MKFSQYLKLSSQNEEIEKFRSLDIMFVDKKSDNNILNNIKKNYNIDITLNENLKKINILLKNINGGKYKLGLSDTGKTIDDLNIDHKEIINEKIIEFKEELNKAKKELEYILKEENK